MCDYSDTYVVFEGAVTVEGPESRDRKNRYLEFKNNAPFFNCVSKINNVLTGCAEDLDVEYSTN